MADHGNDVGVYDQRSSDFSGQNGVATIVESGEGESITAEASIFVNFPNGKTGTVDGIVANCTILSLKGRN
jgi:hypothetical protein